MYFANQFDFPMSAMTNVYLASWRCALDSAQLNSVQLNPAQLISARARLLVGLLWLAGAHFLVEHAWNLPAHSIHRLNQ